MPGYSPKVMIPISMTFQKVGTLITLGISTKRSELVKITYCFRVMIFFCFIVVDVIAT